MKPFTVAALAATALAAALASGAPAGARAQTDSQPTPNDGGPSATERLQEGAAAIVEGLQLLMDQLQSYQPPEVLPNGDIIIRRRSPPGEPSPAPETPKGQVDKPLQL